MSANSLGESELAVIDTALAQSSRSVGIVCTVAGNISFTFAGDGSTYIIPVAVGYTQLNWNITKYNTTGTTATAVVTSLR